MCRRPAKAMVRPISPPDRPATPFVPAAGCAAAGMKHFITVTAPDRTGYAQ
jgi:hypothetical protein